MEKVLNKDCTYLKGDYYKGFHKINSTLSSGVIPKAFRKEVEADVLELFIRNQDNNKDFNEVVGGDINEFIRSIVDVYLDETSTKTKVLNSIGCGLVVSGLFLGFDIFVHSKATIASLIISGGTLAIIAIVILLSYKISKKINPKNIKYIAATTGFGISILSNLFYDNVAFISSSLNNIVDLSVAMIIIMIELIVGLYIVIKIDKQK